MTAAVYMVSCPVHARLVGTDAAGKLVGRCSGCMTDAAVALRKIECGELSVQLLLQGSS